MFVAGILKTNFCIMTLYAGILLNLLNFNYLNIP